MADEQEDIIKSRYKEKRRYKKKKMERQVRNSQRRLKRLRIWYKLFLVILVILISLFILKMPQWRLHTNAFDSLNSPALEITNNQIVPAQKILAALRRNQVPLQPIFLVRTDNLKKSIKQLEPIQDVYIRRFWYPARLQIIVVERTPAISIAPNLEVPPIAFFSSDGILIGHEYMPLSSNFKTVKVVTFGRDDDYRNWDVNKVNYFKKLANAVETESGEKVEYIDYRNPKDVYVKIPTVNIRLGSLNPAVIDKIQRIPSLLPQVKMINKPVKYIDLRWDTNYIKLDE